MLLKYLFTLNNLKHKTSFKISKPLTCFGHNLTIFRECESSYDEVVILYLPVVWRHAFMCLCHVLVCSIDDPAESGGVLVLWSIIWDRKAIPNDRPEDGQVMTETCRSYSNF